MSGFSNRPYVGELSRLDSTSPTLTIRPSNPKGRYASHRQIAAFIYELAAELERMCDETRLDVAVCPEPKGGRIVVEMGRDGNVVLAAGLLRRVLAMHDLVQQASGSAS